MQISAMPQSAISLSSATRAPRAVVSASTAGPAPAARGADRVEVSEQALESSKRAGGMEKDGANPTLQFLEGLVSLVSGRDVEGLAPLPEGGVTAGYSAGSLSAQSVSLSVGGTIAARDGKEIGFSLQLQYDHASLSASSAVVSAGPGGVALSYSGVAAQLESTGFSFTLSAAGDGGKAGGKGVLHLNDEVSRVARELKPFAKEFVQASGLRGGWGQVNRLLRSVA